VKTKRRALLKYIIGSVVAVVLVIIINEIRVSRAIAYIAAVGGAPSVETNWLGEPLEVSFSDWSSPQLHAASIDGISSRLPRLEVLSITHQSIDDAVIIAISNLSQLQELLLDHCHIDATTLTPLQQIATLRGIGLSHSVVTKSFVDSIAQLSSIQGIDLRCTGVTDEQIYDLRRQLVRLRIEHRCPEDR
jgi:hypothetical protein